MKLIKVDDLFILEESIESKANRKDCIVYNMYLPGADHAPICQLEIPTIDIDEEKIIGVFEQADEKFDKPCGNLYALWVVQEVMKLLGEKK